MDALREVPPVAVNCRIGSLEMPDWAKSGLETVNCRIGSLERTALSAVLTASVNCRIGSLETGANRWKTTL